MVDRSAYKVGVVVSIGDCGSKSSLRVCEVNVGDENNPVTVVTAAKNVREGSRVAVALAGSVVELDGEEVSIKKTSVGGVMSEGMLCDSKMLGWAGGGAGVAARIPDTVPIGSPPPAEKPRMGQQSEGDAPPSQEVEGLFAKKLTKEEKKKLAEERRKARKAAKEAKKGGGDDAST